MTMVREGLCFDMVEDIKYVVVGGVWWVSVVVVLFGKRKTAYESWYGVVGSEMGIIARARAGAMAGARVSGVCGSLRRMPLNERKVYIEIVSQTWGVFG